LAIMGLRWCAVVVLMLTVNACSAPPAPPPPPAPRPAVTTVAPPAEVTYPVAVRVLKLHRGPRRGLPTMIWSPQAPGRFPLVLFSHGLAGSPDRYAATLAGWAAAGFIVAAPRFPHTSEFADHFKRSDIVNQPDDARYVLNQVRRLDVTRGDPLWHRIDREHMAAIGHSAGGYTTSGLFTAGHDPRLVAGIIMAGWAAPGAFAGPPARMLFLQGIADPIVPVSLSRKVYGRVPWPKSYLLLRHDSHGTYLHPGGPGYRRMNAAVIDFLRRTLRGADAARRARHNGSGASTTGDPRRPRSGTDGLFRAGHAGPGNA
jgi:dienelactone hydrolase